MCKRILLLLFLLLFSLQAWSDYVLSDTSFIRLRLLLQSSLNLSEQETNLLIAFSETQLHYEATLRSLESNLASLNELSQRDKQTIAKLSESLQKQLIDSVVCTIVVSAISVGIGFVFGYIVRGATIPATMPKPSTTPETVGCAKCIGERKSDMS